MTIKYGKLLSFVIQVVTLGEDMIIANQMTAYAFYICLAGIPLLIVWFVNGLTIWEIIGEYEVCKLA